MPIVPPSSFGSTSGGGGTVLFDSTLGADTAAIDTGAGGISAAYTYLKIYALIRTDDAGAGAVVDVTINGLGGANYRRQQLSVSNGATGSANPAATSAWPVNCRGSGASANYFAMMEFTFPFYSNTAVFKQGFVTIVMLDGTVANNFQEYTALACSDTTALNQFKIAGQAAAKLKSGSRVLIIGF